MPRSEHLADMHTDDLHDERAACLLLTTDHYAGTERVKEFHADLADRISDEIDSRNNTQPQPTPPDDDEPDNECSRGECLGIHQSAAGYRDCDGNPI